MVPSCFVSEKGPLARNRASSAPALVKVRAVSLISAGVRSVSSDTPKSVIEAKAPPDLVTLNFSPPLSAARFKSAARPMSNAPSIFACNIPLVPGAGGFRSTETSALKVNLAVCPFLRLSNARLTLASSVRSRLPPG